MKEIRGYVARSVLSTFGLSLYILADTFFIANGVGTLGLTALNIALPLFNLLNGLGLLLGMGGATLFVLKGGKGNYFSQLLITGMGVGLFFTFLGVTAATSLASLLGASLETLQLTTTYLRFILIMAPFFICNNLVLAFIRNDNNPQLAMKAMLFSSLFNIIFDYIFVFFLHMGMAGAALATVLSPVLSLMILSTHRKKNNRHLFWQPTLPQLKTISRSAQLGLASFLTEMSTGISILVFNQVLLTLSGDIAVAAYGVLANILLVGLSLFTGVAQGIQPLISQAAAKKERAKVFSYLRYGFKVSLSLALLLYLIVTIFKFPIVGLFNRENNIVLTQLATNGIQIYFLALLGACLNIVFSIFFSAVGYAKQSFTVAVLRGYVLILPLVVLLGKNFGIIGVWSSLPLSEFFTLLLASLLFVQVKKSYRQNISF
ncbi:multidrug transporter MatE [Enterococcus saigonensis]|uniref:Multidrug transporter MatE n=1 Tax=Enterococcus saigonensis TaxID=1805431 RepID=A0A679INZ2_9ENTE|nr:MATE family efflux transporter [Enterococcus saigonensis]BCA86581.1 multidrug transporter MatE [Enterococcus saigonensis]